MPKKLDVTGIPMGKHSVIRKPRVTTYRGKAGPCGVEVNTRARDNGKLGRPLGLIAINLRSGLFDPGSAGLEGLAEELYEHGKGNFVVSTIGTNYPKFDVVRMAKGLRDARHARAVSMYRAIQHVNSKYRPHVAIQKGLSEGGISVIDGTDYWVKHARKQQYHPAKTAVLTVNSPLKIEQENNPIKISQTLAKLGLNCLPDMLQLDLSTRFAMTRAQQRHKASPWDVAYGAAEINYIRKGIDLYSQVERLEQAGVPVWHVSYTHDVVQNTVINFGQSHEFPGGHVRPLREPEPVIERIGELAARLVGETGTDPRQFGLAA